MEIRAAHKNCGGGAQCAQVRVIVLVAKGCKGQRCTAGVRRVARAERVAVGQFGAQLPADMTSRPRQRRAPRAHGGVRARAPVMREMGCHQRAQASLSARDVISERSP